MYLFKKFNTRTHNKNVNIIGRGSVGSSSNAIPLGGGRAGIGSGSSTVYSDSGSSKLQMNFQKASSAETELGLLRSGSTSTQTHSRPTLSSSTGNQRKRRWDT